MTFPNDKILAMDYYSRVVCVIVADAVVLARLYKASLVREPRFLLALVDDVAQPENYNFENLSRKLL